MNKPLFKIAWLPVLGVWALLAAVYVNRASGLGLLARPPLLLLAYMIVSSMLVSRSVARISHRSEAADSVTVVSQAYSSLVSLAIATIIAVFGALASQMENWWFCAAIGACVVVQKVSEGLGDYSNDQLVQGAQSRQVERQTAVETRDEFKLVLQELSAKYRDDTVLISEVNRIAKIVPYSSYFRSNASRELLCRLRNESDAAIVIGLLRNVH